MVCADVVMASLVGGRVMVNVAEGVFVPSLAVTVVPPVARVITVKVQLKLPLVAPEVHEPGMVVVPNVMAMDWDAAKPVPATVTLVPLGPELGLKVIARVTVNVAVTECVVSLAVTVRPPAGALGTVKEQ